MTIKEREQIIWALEIIYDWIDYTPEYFLKKRNWETDKWETDKEKIEKAKQIVQKSDQLVGVDDVDLGVVINTIYVDSRTIDTQLVNPGDADWERCPKCESTRIEFDVDGIEPDGQFIYRVHSCRDCKTFWEERYDLVKINVTYVEDDESKED